MHNEPTVSCDPSLGATKHNDTCLWFVRLYCIESCYKLRMKLCDKRNEHIAHVRMPVVHMYVGFAASAIWRPLLDWNLIVKQFPSWKSYSRRISISIVSSAYNPIQKAIYTETEMSSFWWNFHHWLHWKLSKWQLPVQPVMKISSKWRHFRFSDRRR